MEFDYRQLRIDTKHFPTKEIQLDLGAGNWIRRGHSKLVIGVL
jgi:hypothetical protein